MYQKLFSSWNGQKYGFWTLRIKAIYSSHVDLFEKSAKPKESLDSLDHKGPAHNAPSPLKEKFTQALGDAGIFIAEAKSSNVELMALTYLDKEDQCKNGKN